ncbi:Wadjet anti-phage system protein JetD domain-containing protein [Arthrobacter sp. JSM 101049]|uniref:Wadjet anti-phage system protein JetD domain-containing protein n=1 Tax=Arthrobacter sp. JSM 101049 TaxID=929097 RepID=UPI003562D312
MRGADVVYWGDLDSHGFAILNRLRAHGVTARSVLMDTATLDAYADLCVPEPAPSTATLEYLTTAERDTLGLLAERGNVRLEQERIDWDHAVAVLIGAAGRPPGSRPAPG